MAAARAITLMLLAVADLAAAGPPSPTDLANIGLTAVRDELGSGAPTGAGITVTQVEAPLGGSSTQYFVDTTNSDFAGKTITDKTGGGTVSTHATNVAQNFYGNNGISPGVATADVYEANDWLDTGFLRTLSPQAPRVETRKVENHSWIGNFQTSDGNPDTVTATDVLRRLDYVVNRDHVVAVVGVDNGIGSPLPQVLANAYNAIAVGRSDGGGSVGPTNLDGLGRSKPDLVAPAYNTSVATAWVSGAATLLLQAGGGNADAQQPETIKSLLLAGASKSPFADWNHTQTQPLDLRYGAGQLDIDASYHILAAGEQHANSLADVLPTGWDHALIGAGGQRDYFFTIPNNAVGLTFSAVAAWNRQISFTPGFLGNPATFTPSLANIDIKLYEANGFTKGTLIDQSISTIDNVEHVFERGLSSGHYVLSVTSNAQTNVALAWHADLLLKGDANRDGIVNGLDYAIWAQNYLSTTAPYTNGDFDGDGRVTGLDYALWAQYYNPATTARVAAIAAIPEPASLVLLVGALPVLAVFAAARRNRRRRRDCRQCY